MLGEIMAISRLRMASDGAGVTTLVAFFGCPLHCRYCVNWICHDIDTARKYYTPENLVSVLNQDDIYFKMTSGGVVFGGGEPLLQAEFLVDCLGKCVARSIQTCVDTAAAVRTPLMDEIIRLTDIFLLDVKTADKAKFSEYVGHGFDVFLEIFYPVVVDN